MKVTRCIKMNGMCIFWSGTSGENGTNFGTECPFPEVQEPESEIVNKKVKILFTLDGHHLDNRPFICSSFWQVVYNRFDFLSFIVQSIVAIATLENEHQNCSIKNW